MLDDLTLSPAMGVILVIIMAVSGQAFRSTWKKQGEGWVLRAWIFAMPAIGAILALAFIPLDI